MRFNNLIKVFLIGLFCGTSNSDCAIENCKPLFVKLERDRNQTWSDTEVHYTDCSGRRINSWALPFESSSYFSVSAGTTVGVSVHLGYSEEFGFLIGDGITIDCHPENPRDHRSNVTCKATPTPEDCKPLNVTYDSAHFWASVKYMNCGGEVVTETVPTGNGTFLVRAGTAVDIGPVDTATNYIYQHPIGTGLNVKCSGWLGSTGNCTVY